MPIILALNLEAKVWTMSAEISTPDKERTNLYQPCWNCLSGYYSTEIYDT